MHIAWLIPFPLRIRGFHQQASQYSFVRHPEQWSGIAFEIWIANKSSSSAYIKLSVDRGVIWTHMSECVPANQTSFTRGITPSVIFVEAVCPAEAYSGRNLTRRSSRARAWRKKQVFSGEVVPGRFLPLTTPIDETVSLYPQGSITHLKDGKQLYNTHQAPIKCTWTFLE